MPDQKRDRAVQIGWTWILAAFLSLPLLATSATGGDAEVAALHHNNDSTHVYLAPGDLDRFVNSFTAAFGGQSSKKTVGSFLPVPSSAEQQYIGTPVGTLSIFAFQTPIPFPFGQERTGYLVTDMDQALKAARSAGAEVIVESFKDPIGIDAVIQWPGGVKMQLYWHFTPPASPPLETIPDNRIYVSPDQADKFVKAFVRFSHGKVVSDDKQVDGLSEIGRARETYRRINIMSLFGNMQVLVTDGHLPYPFGHEITGYQVPNLGATLEKAKAASVKILSPSYTTNDRISAMVEFPGGYIAEIHSLTERAK